MNINVVQVGTGGTGSYLVPPLSKFIRSLIKTGSYKIKYILIDGDTVEEKNVYRQNFDFDDIDFNKAEVLKNKYNMGDLFIYSIDCILEPKYQNILDKILSDSELNIVIGCVDNIKARVNIAEMLLNFLNKNNIKTFYIDSGNFINNGQIYVFNYTKNTAEEILDKIESIFIDDDNALNMDSAPSCSDNGDQSIMCNFQAANILYNIVTEILVDKTTTIKKITFMRYSREIDYDYADQLKRGNA